MQEIKTAAIGKIGKGKRPIFIPDLAAPGVREERIEFDWHMGMSAAVKKRSVISLHEQAANKGYSKILEASSKSENQTGLALSAFFLKDENGIPVENLFQSSKVFENGGPFLDLQKVSPRDAKKDPRLKESGKMMRFSFNHKAFPLEPKSLFYDWLYSQTLYNDKNIDLKNWLLDSDFDAFSDIEFNPEKSFSCQARTLALFVSLCKTGCLREFLSNPLETANTYQLYKNIHYGEHKSRIKNSSPKPTTKEMPLPFSQIPLSEKKKEDKMAESMEQETKITPAHSLRQTIQSITLGVADLATSRRFYQEVFGWQETGDSDEKNAYFELEQTFILKLRQRKNRDEAINFSFNFVHNVASRETLDNLFSWFACQGVKIIKEPYNSEDKYCGYIADPDGFFWEIVYDPYAAALFSASFTNPVT